jgi:meiotically up-regulated gene 157 (Mug157) protein
MLFENCLPNTLDTTVYFSNGSNSITGERLDTFIVTGDIDAMWTRDSTNQVWPYMQFARQDSKLKDMLHGLINRQTYNILLDPYANAYNKDLSSPGPFMRDLTWKPSFLGTQVAAMTFHLHERKFELDSLCAFLKLSRGYFAATKESTPFNANWLKAVSLVLDVFSSQQQGIQNYFFQRAAVEPTDTLLHGVGAPTNYTGMCASPFRPSDDATTYPFLVPANAMAVVELRNLAAMLDDIFTSNETKILAKKARKLSQEIAAGIAKFGIMPHLNFGNIYAFEVDGFGSVNWMDDPGIPGLLSLPYVDFLPRNDSIYLNTRKYVMSTNNPYYALFGFPSSIPGGLAGPHIGPGYVHPLAIIMQALTSQRDEEITACLELIKKVSLPWGFIHETFWKDDPNNFTRPWFAMANSLFGELILMLARERPYLIF